MKPTNYRMTVVSTTVLPTDVIPETTPSMTGNSTSVPGCRKQLFLSVLNPTSCTFCPSLAVAFFYAVVESTQCRSLQCIAKTFSVSTV
jgi:hypothetical protein